MSRVAADLGGPRAGHVTRGSSTLTSNDVTQPFSVTLRVKLVKRRHVMSDAALGRPELTTPNNLAGCAKVHLPPIKLFNIFGSSWLYVKPKASKQASDLYSANVSQENQDTLWMVARGQDRLIESSRSLDDV